MKKLSQSKGFTLIELVVVIVILGILAATAAPKFIDLTGDARKSVIQGLQGSVNSALNMVYAKALVAGETGDTGQVIINGEYYYLVYGYPARLGQDDADGEEDNGYGIDQLIELESGTKITYDSATGDFEHSEATDADGCKVTYSNATAAGAVITPASAVLTVTDC